jgi:hypothetical protein
MSAFRPDIRPYRYAGNPTIPLVASSWYESQIYDFCVFVDPTDSTKLVMYCSGMASPVNSGVQSIGRFTATVADPYTWTNQGQVLTASVSGWDSDKVRLGSVVYDSGTWYMYYCNASGDQSIGLATSSNGTTFTKSASNPILTPTGQGRNDGTSVSEATVIKEGSSWTMIYGYRNGVTILPGYRYATSSDGVTWTKGGSGDILTTSPLYAEFHQLIKIDGLYYLIYETGSDTVPYHINGAVGPTAIGPFTQLALNPLLEKSDTPGSFDRYHVATASIFQVGGRWLMFYQGAQDHDQPYYTNSWPGGIAEFALRETGSGGGNGR